MFLMPQKPLRGTRTYGSASASGWVAKIDIWIRPHRARSTTKTGVMCVRASIRCDICISRCHSQAEAALVRDLLALWRVSYYAAGGYAPPADLASPNFSPVALNQHADLVGQVRACRSKKQIVRLLKRMVHSRQLFWRLAEDLRGGHTVDGPQEGAMYDDTDDEDAVSEDSADFSDAPLMSPLRSQADLPLEGDECPAADAAVQSPPLLRPYVRVTCPVCTRISACLLWCDFFPGGFKF